MQTLRSVLQYIGYSSPSFSLPTIKAPSSAEMPSKVSFGHSGYSHTPIARNVRVLFVNGLRHTYKDCEQAAQSVSKIFLNTRVDFAHLNLGVGDVYKVLRQKELESLGMITPLARKIESLAASAIHAHKEEVDEDLGGKAYSDEDTLSSFSQRRYLNTSESRSKVVIVGHSGAAAMIHAALQKVDVEHRKSIEVITLGGSYMLPNEHGIKAHNIVHMTDWVPSLAWLVTKSAPKNAPVTYIGSRWAKPMSGHTFLGPDYQEALKHIVTNSFLYTIIQIEPVGRHLQEKKEDTKSDRDSEITHTGSMALSLQRSISFEDISDEEV